MWLEHGQQGTAFPGPQPKKKKKFSRVSGPRTLVVVARGVRAQTPASVRSELVVVSSPPRPRFKASGAGRAPRVRAPGYFYLLPPQLQCSPFSAVAHASSAQGINENSSRGGRAPARGKKKKTPRRTPGTQREGQIQLGLPGRGVSLGFSSSQLPGEREEFRLGPTCPGGGIQAA